METVKLSSKGQFTLPKAIRDRHHWEAGTEFFIIDRGAELVIKPIRVFPGLNWSLQMLLLSTKASRYHWRRWNLQSELKREGTDDCSRWKFASTAENLDAVPSVILIR